MPIRESGRVMGRIGAAMTLVLTGLTALSGAPTRAASVGSIDLQIIGGAPATAEAAPWQVRLEITTANGNRILCGGSILGPTWVLTAAHCLMDAEQRWAAAVEVTAGVTRLGSTGQTARGVSMHVPRTYSARTFAADIGLVELGSSLRLDGVHTAAVALPHHVGETWPMLGADLHISGWGLTAQDPEVRPRELHHGVITVRAAPGGACDGRSLANYLPELMMCAGLPDGAVDVCAGDSGGAAVVRSSGVGVVAGVASHGAGRCGSVDYPSVFTRVRPFLAWISSITGLTPSRDASPAATSPPRAARPEPSGALQQATVIGGSAVVSDEVLTEVAELTSATLTRVAGRTRYATTVAVTRAVHPHGAAVVYLASGAGFADALSASTALARGSAALLLSPADHLPDEVAAELRRLGPSQVVLIGGEAALSARVAAQVASVTGVVPSRIEGADRYATAVAVSRSVVPAGGASVLYLATGAGYADALSAAVALTDPQASLLLTAPGHLPEVVAAEIRRLAPQTVYVIGGAGAVSERVLREVGAASGVTPQRIAGDTRACTAASVSEHARPEGASKVFIVTGGGFADALAAAQGVLSGEAALLLVGRDAVPEATERELIRLTTMARDAVLSDR